MLGAETGNGKLRSMPPGTLRLPDPTYARWNTPLLKTWRSTVKLQVWTMTGLYSLPGGKPTVPMLWVVGGGDEAPNAGSDMVPFSNVVPVWKGGLPRSTL